MAFRPHRSMTAPLRGRLRDREGRRPPQADPTVRSRRPSPARSRPFGSTARLPRQRARRRSRRRGPPAPVTDCSRTRRGRLTSFRTPWPSVPRPATTRLQPCQRIALWAGGVRGDLVRRGRPGCSERPRACRLSESAISSMTPFSTPNRSARTTAPVPCNASRLSTATTAVRPIFAASVRADSLSALESRRVSPPEPSRWAMADPIPPVPMIAVVMTETSPASCG